MTITTKRKCGECAACCTVLGIEEIGKPPNAACPNMKSCGTNRCKVHQTPALPSVCSGYLCMWLTGNFTADDRPDKIGVIFDGNEVDGYYILSAREVWAGAASSPRAKELIDKLARGTVVIVIQHASETRRLICSNAGIIATLRPRLQAAGLLR